MAPVYLVTEVDVTDPEGYANLFAPGAQKTIKEGGGVPIAVGGAGGAGAKGITHITGAPAPTRAVIHRWESIERVTTWFHSREYQDLLRIGEKFATFRGFVIDGIE
jgi:uncharacterized protein (DUF1330 family)